MTDEVVELDNTSERGPEGRRPNMLGRLWSACTGDDTVRPLTVIAWLALLVLMCVELVDTVTYDFTVHPIVGDQASHLLTALSIAGPGHNLSYDLRDLQQFDAVHWMPRLYGLWFQRYGDGWAEAKPYGYGVYASPFFWVFGAIRGAAIANTALLVMLTTFSIAMLRLRYRGPVVPLTVGAFVFLGLPFFYAYVLHPDLLLAVLTALVFLLVLLHWKTKHVAFAVAATAASALLFVENPRALIVVLPPLVLVLWELRSWKKRLVVFAGGAVALCLVIAPNLNYSDGRSWNAYGGERYVAASSLGADVPFDGIHVVRGDGWRRVHTGEKHSVSAIVDRLFADPEAEAEAAFYYFFGRHTGMLVFMPVGFLLLLLVLVRVRELDRYAWAILLGILGYIAFYVLAYPGNYYGGGQSLGNRYFLQVSPALLALAVTAQLRARAIAWAAIAGTVLAVAFMFPHFEDPSGAYSEGLPRTSWLQRQLPFETVISGARAFREPR